MVGVFPKPAAPLRLAGAVLTGQLDGWEAGNRRYFLRSLNARAGCDDYQGQDDRRGTRIPELTARRPETTSLQRDVTGENRGIGLHSAARDEFSQVKTHTERVNLQMMHPRGRSKEMFR